MSKSQGLPHATVIYFLLAMKLALLRLRYKVPVFPVVVYLTAGSGGLREAVYEETLFGQTILTFHFQGVGLPDLAADD